LREPVFSKPMDLLSKVAGIEFGTPAQPDECCGFGGTFSVFEEVVSTRMGYDKATDFARAGATATRVAEFVFDEGLAQGERPRDIRAWIEGQLHQPRYWPTDLRMARSCSCEESHGRFDLW
jgi:hypothetical protein